MWIENRGEGGVGMKYSWSAPMVGAEARIVTKKTFCQRHCSSSWLKTLIDNGTSGTLVCHCRKTPLLRALSRQFLCRPPTKCIGQCSRLKAFSKSRPYNCISAGSILRASMSGMTPCRDIGDFVVAIYTMPVNHLRGNPFENLGTSGNVLEILRLADLVPLIRLESSLCPM